MIDEQVTAFVDSCKSANNIILPKKKKKRLNSSLCTAQQCSLSIILLSHICSFPVSLNQKVFITQNSFK